jgi:hypothetical protein
MSRAVSTMATSRRRRRVGARREGVHDGDEPFVARASIVDGPTHARLARGTTVNDATDRSKDRLRARVRAARGARRVEESS